MKLFKSFKVEELKQDTSGIINIMALLIEASSIDGEISENEVEKIVEMILNYFDLDSETVNDYYNQAKLKQQDSVSFHEFTSKIHQEFNYKQKIDILEMLWHVVLADQKEHEFESNLMRRVSGLLHFRDVDNGIARRSVLKKLEAI